MISSTSHQALRSTNAYFGGCDYLGLSQHLLVKASVMDAISSYGISVGASRVTSGTLDVHHECELLIATICGTEKSTLLPSGFLANVAVAEVVNSAKAQCLVVKDAHPSFLSAVNSMWVSTFSTYESLILKARDLEQACDPYFVYVDSVNSVSYEKAPVQEIVSVVRSGRVVIDESHVFGLSSPFVQPKRASNIIVTSSLSKAVGQFGGFVASSSDFSSSLNSSGAFRASTPLPAAICCGILSALEICTDGDVVAKLKRNAEYFRQEMLLYDEEIRPVYCFYDLVEGAIEGLYRSLLAKGIYVPYIERYGDFHGVLRVAICADHSTEQLDDLVSIIKSFSDVITLDAKLTRQTT